MFPVSDNMAAERPLAYKDPAHTVDYLNAVQPYLVTLFVELRILWGQNNVNSNKVPKPL